MNTLKNNKSTVKSLFLALAVVFAIGFSAFTNRTVENSAPKALKAGMIVGDYIVQPDPNEFRDYTLMTPPNPNDCGDPATKNCIYHVTTLGKSNIPVEPSGGYTSSDIEDYLRDGWLEPVENPEGALFNGTYQ